MTEAEIRRTWEALRRYYPNSNRSGERTMQAYLDALEPYPAAAVNAACKAYVQEGGKYWPDVADIIQRLPREAAAVQDRFSRGGTEDDMLGNIKAWAVVNGLTMPKGMTLREAREWRREQST